MWSNYPNPLNKEEMREYHRFYRLALSDECKLRRQKWSSKNSAKLAVRCKIWQQNNPEKYKECCRRYRQSHLEKYREIDRKRRSQKTIYTRNRRKNNINFRLAGRLRSRMNAALRGKNKAFGTNRTLGCSIESFKIYLESKFEPGMSWNNYGRNGWHIDHIMPCAIFDLTKPEHQKRCFHFSNMQPMWAQNNVRKGRRIFSEQFALL